MTKLRDAYFEDQRAQPYTDRRGRTRVRYVYQGDWVRLGLGEGLWRRKLLCGGLEVLSVALMLLASAWPHDFNRGRAVAALGVLAYVPWLLELWGAGRFCLSRRYIRDFDRKTMDWQIRTGGALRALLVLASALCGLIGSRRSGTLDGPALLIAAGYLASAALSAAVGALWRRLGWRTYRNADGKPGAEY